jgi:hypothetical protein
MIDNINSILNMYNTSPSIKRAINYGTAERERQRRAQIEQNDRDNEAYNSSMKRLQEIEAKAQTLTYGRPDVAKRFQEDYAQLRNGLLETLQSKYNNDLTKFWYQGGQAELDMFEQSLFGGELAQNLAASKPEVQKYLDVIEQKDGSSRVFKSTMERFKQFTDGDIDSFTFGYDMMAYNKPTGEEVKTIAGNRLIDKYMNYNDNAEIARLNYLNEFNYPADKDVSYETLADYMSGYIGGAQAKQPYISGEPKYSRTIFDAISVLGDRSQIGVVGSRDSRVGEGISRLSELTGLDLNNRIQDTPVGGFKAFVGDETKLIEAFVDPQFDSKNFEPTANIILQNVDHTTGEMFGTNGVKLDASEDIQGEKVKMHGVFLGFKTLDGEDRLLMQNELDTYSGPVKPMYVMAMKDEGFLFGDDYIYKELQFEDPRKAKLVNKLIQVEEEDLTRQLQNSSDRQEPVNDVKVSFSDINLKSNDNRLYEFAATYDQLLESELPALGLQNPSLKIKSTLLALNLMYGGNEMDEFLRFFHAGQNPEFNRGLITNDSQLLLKNLGDVLIARGESQEQVDALLTQTAELSKKINNAIINKSNL